MEIQKPDNYLVWTILVTFLFCMPFGIIGLIYAVKVDSAWNEGRFEEAIEASQKARQFALFGMVLWGVATVLTILFSILSYLGVFAAILAGMGFVFVNC